MNLIGEPRSSSVTLTQTWWSHTPKLPNRCLYRFYPLSRWMRNNAWPWAGVMVVQSIHGETRYQVMHVEDAYTVRVGFL